MLSPLKKYLNRFTELEQKLLLVFFLIFIVSTTAWVNQSQSADQVPAPGGEYTEGLAGQPQHINPLLAPLNDVDSDLSRVIYDGLYEFDDQLNLAPDLAEALPEVTDGGRVYTITLKEDILWHDEQPLTADDVVFTYGRIQNPEYFSPHRFSWDRVGIEKLDERTVKLTLKEPSATFVANLTVGILPKHIWEPVEPAGFPLSKFNLEPVGSGAFRLDSVKRNGDGGIKEMKLVRFQQYHKQTPYLEKIKFKFYRTADKLIDAYQSRDVEGLGYVPYALNLFLKGRSNLKQINLTLPQYQAVFINQSKNPAALGDANIRMALAKSVDKQKIISEVYGGQAQEAFGPILPGHLGYHEQIPGADMNLYDREKAKALLEEAGWAMDEGLGFRRDDQERIITVELVTNNFTPNIRVAELLKEMWEEIGVQVILKIETIADLETQYIRPRNYELLLFSENVGADPDPYPFWHSSQVRDPGLNLTTFANAEADKLLVEARVDGSPEERALDYRKFQEIFVGHVPAIFISRSIFVYYVPEKIKGLKVGAVVTSSDRFGNIEEWFVKTK